MSGRWQERLRREWRNVLLGLILGGASLMQLAWVGRHSGRLLVAKVWENRHLDAISRSADAAYGYDYMRWIDFLRTEIPQEGRAFVVYSPESPQFTIAAFLGYFLIPRHVSTCPSSVLQDCIDQVAGPGVYFLYTDGLDETLRGYHGLHVIPFDDRLGLLAPGEGMDS